MAARPDTGAVDAASAAVGEDTVHHHVEILLPLIDLIVAEQNLRKSGAMSLDPRIAAITIDRCRTPEDQAASATVEHRGSDIAFARINRNRLAGNACLEKRFCHPVRRPGLLGSWFEDEADLERIDRKPQRVNAG